MQKPIEIVSASEIEYFIKSEYVKLEKLKNKNILIKEIDISQKYLHIKKLSLDDNFDKKLIKTWLSTHNSWKEFPEINYSIVGNISNFEDIKSKNKKALFLVLPQKSTNIVVAKNAYSLNSLFYQEDEWQFANFFNKFSKEIPIKIHNYKDVVLFFKWFLDNFGLNNHIFLQNKTLWKWFSINSNGIKNNPLETIEKILEKYFSPQGKIELLKYENLLLRSVNKYKNNLFWLQPPAYCINLEKKFIYE